MAANFEALKKIIKKSRFVGIKKFLRGTSLFDVQIWMENKKNFVMGTLRRLKDIGLNCIKTP